MDSRLVDLVLRKVAAMASITETAKGALARRGFSQSGAGIGGTPTAANLPRPKALLSDKAANKMAKIVQPSVKKFQG